MSPSEAAGRPEAAFNRYADWYDAFNAGKSYASEVDYVLKKVERVVGRPRRWLDIGCGTGHHLAHLHERGVAVEGVDRSHSMIARARAAHPDIPFHVGTAQEFAIDGDRDVVSMLFHVLNYQVTDAMISGALERIAAHLAPGGVFAFDFWNSDAVRRDPPGPRARSARVGERVLYRLSSPVDDPAQRLVTVHYRFHWDSPDGELVHEETHALRHFSTAELDASLRRAGLALGRCDAWLTDRPISADDWYGFACARHEQKA